MEDYNFDDSIISFNIGKKLSLTINICGRKFWVGIILTFFIVILCYVGHASITAKVVLTCGCFLFSVINLKCKDRLATWMNYIWGTFASCVIFYLTQLLLNVGIEKLNSLRIVLGILICSLVMQVFFLCSGNCRIAVWGSTIVLMGLTIINYFVLNFRGNEIMLADFKAIGTAAAVAGQYDYSIDSPFAYAVILATIYCYIGFCIPEIKVAKNKRTIVMKAIVCLCVTISVVVAGTQKVDAYHFSNEGSLYNGFLVNFLCRIETARVERPTGYSVDIIKNLEEQYDDKELDVSINKNLPHIIVIMNETFADLEVVGHFDTDVEITPFFNSLQENTIRGYALTSVFGGGTCNSEFEMLTGYSMGLLPQSSYPFQQFIKHNTWSIVEVLKSKGYVTIGTHPQKGTNWMRSTVYPLLGFDEIYFLEDYPQQNLIRGHVSDQEMYEQIISWYEKKSIQGEKLFLFGVTMQNHSPYDVFSSELHNIVNLQGTGEYLNVEQYLTLLNYSDKALEYLVNYFEEQDEDVLLLFFGDHLPRIDEEFYDYIQQSGNNTKEQQIKKYTVPFLLWANYDIEERDNEFTSLNYLSNYVYEAMGVDFPSFNQFLKDVQEVIPAMNSFGFYSNEKKMFVSYEEANDVELDLLHNYEILQYNGLFDSENVSVMFTGE